METRACHEPSIIYLTQALNSNLFMQLFIFSKNTFYEFLLFVFELELSFFSATAAPHFHRIFARHRGHMTTDKPVMTLSQKHLTSYLIEENHGGSQGKNPTFSGLLYHGKHTSLNSLNFLLLHFESSTFPGSFPLIITSFFFPPSPPFFSPPVSTLMSAVCV